MRRHGVLGPLGLGLQAPPLPHCILPYGADARVHAEHGVPGTRSCGLFCLSAERQLALSGLAPFAALCAAPAERQLALSGLAPFAALCAASAERQLALSGLAPFRPRAAPAERQLCHPALSALLRHQRSSALPLGAGYLFCPFMALPRLAALAERQLCRT